MAFQRNTPVVAVNDLRNPPNVGLIVGPRPSHRVATLDPRESQEIEIYVVAWPVSGRLAYVEAPGINLRRATPKEIQAVVDAFGPDS